MLEFGSGAVSKSLYEGSYRMSCTNVCGLIDLQCRESCAMNIPCMEYSYPPMNTL